MARQICPLTFVVVGRGGGVLKSHLQLFNFPHHAGVLTIGGRVLGALATNRGRYKSRHHARGGCLAGQQGLQLKFSKTAKNIKACKP